MADDSLGKGADQLKTGPGAKGLQKEPDGGLHRELFGEKEPLSTNEPELMAKNALREVAFATPVSAGKDFSGAKKADAQAADFWTNKIDQNANPDFRDILTFRTWVHNAAIQRLTGAGGLAESTTGKTVGNLKKLAALDPDLATRKVPVAPAGPAHLTADMQRTLLSYVALDFKDGQAPEKPMTINNVNVRLIDVELAYRAGANLDIATGKKLHKEVASNLGHLFSNKYDAAEKTKLANDNGLSEDEIDDLYSRFEAAKDFLKKNP